LSLADDSTASRNVNLSPDQLAAQFAKSRAAIELVRGRRLSWLPNTLQQRSLGDGHGDDSWAIDMHLRNWLRQPKASAWLLAGPPASYFGKGQAGS